MQDGHEPRMTTGPGSFNNKTPWIIMPFGSRAMDAVRTRKLPSFPDSKPGVKWPLASGVYGRRAEQGAENQDLRAGVEGEEQVFSHPQFSLLHAGPVLGRPAWGPRDGLPCPCFRGVPSHGLKPLELTTAYGKC